MPRSKEKRKIRVLTLDTETAGLGGEIRRCALYDGKRVTYGYTFSDLLPVIDDLYEWGYDVHIYIHNLEFDARKMPEIFRRGNVDWEKTKIINGKYALIACTHYKLHDSFKLLPRSLDAISKSFGVAHAKIDLWDRVQKEYHGQYKNKVDFFERCPVDDALYLEYLGYDVISLFEVLEKLLDVSGIALDDFVKRLSTASLSRFIFRQGYKGQAFQTDGEERTDYEILTCFKKWGNEKPEAGKKLSFLQIENLIRASYCGGRCEVFRPTCGRAKHYDVNSLYPSVMMLLKKLGENPVSVGYNFPVGYPEYIDAPEEAELCFEKWLRDGIGLGFLSCALYIPRQYVPPLPVKMGKLAFVTGYVSGTWTFTELAYAVRNCGVKILSCNFAIFFRRTFPVFYNFIKVFSAMKTEAKRTGQKALTEFTKLIQNTGYGWTALARDDKTDVKPIEKKGKYKSRILQEDEELGFVEIQAQVNGDSIQVAVGAYVTSYARLVLLDSLRRQAAQGNIYYCDTDSIVCDTDFPPELVDPAKLGFWDCENDHIEKALFLQPKVYAEQSDKLNKKFKGVSRDTQAGFQWEFYAGLYNKLASGEHGKVEVEHGKERLASLLVAQKNGVDPNKITVIDKGLNLDGARKRDIDYKRGTSEPWHMETPEMFEQFNFAPDYEYLREKDGGFFDPKL